MKRILAQKNAMLVSSDFQKEESSSSDHADLSVVYREAYSQKVLEIEGLRPYLFRVTPDRDNQKPFLVQIFATHISAALRFCANNYPLKSIEHQPIINGWVLLSECDSARIEKLNKRLDKK